MTPLRRRHVAESGRIENSSITTAAGAALASGTRLASALNADGGEVGQVWSVLGGGPGPFVNLQRFDYGSGTEDASDMANAWSFSTVDIGGYPESTSRTYEFFAVAVRNGDVITAVPELQALVLVLVLLALGAAGACDAPDRLGAGWPTPTPMAPLHIAAVTAL